MSQNRRRVAIMLELDWLYKRHTMTFVGVQRYAREQNWESVVDEFADNSLARFDGTAQQYDGVIARGKRRLFEAATRCEVPLVDVLYNPLIEDPPPGVNIDFRESGQLIANHLLSRGLRSFGVLLTKDDHAHRSELDAIRASLSDHGLDCVTAWISRNHSNTLAQWQNAKKAIAIWMDQWQLPIGVYVSSHSINPYVVQQCWERGWRIPEDVAIIAGHNEETFCENVTPTITSIEMGYERLGYEAAKLLHQLMDNPNLENRHVLVPPEGIVVRESTDFFAVDDELVAASLAFIARNCHRQIGQDDVAKAVNAETRTLQNRFRKVLDKPIVATIRNLRLDRAKRELVQTDHSLQQIANDVGLGDQFQLCKVFRRELGISPNEFRKQRKL